MTYKEFQLQNEQTLSRYKELGKIHNVEIESALKTIEIFHNASRKFLELNPEYINKEI